MKKPFWEDTYSDMNASTFGGPSQEIRDIASQLPTGSRVLDLGSGEGRNALFLAERGFDVTAVDISEAGIRRQRHPDVRWASTHLRGCLKTPDVSGI